MSLSERFLAEGNERADQMAKDGAMLDGGEMAQRRASTVELRREEVHVALQYAAGVHCLVEEWRDRKELKSEPTEKCTERSPRNAALVCNHKADTVA